MPRPALSTFCQVQTAGKRLQQVKHRVCDLQANEQLQARLEALRNQPCALAQALAKQEEHIRDRDKFKTLIENLQVGPV